MRFHIKENLFSNRKRLVIVIFIVIILLIAIVGLSVMLDPSSSLEVRAVISVSSENSRVDEDITFDAGKSKGNIKIYFWDFGDGNNSTDKITIYKYSIAGWYNVSLTITDYVGSSSISSMSIAIQRQDEVVTRDIDALVWISSGRVGPSLALDIGPNVGNPTIFVEIRIEGVTGKIGISYWYYSNNDIHVTEILFEEYYTKIRDTFDYSRTVQGFELPDDPISVTTSLAVHVWIDQGKWDGGFFSMSTSYPDSPLR